MILIENLENASVSINLLENYVSNNFELIYDFFTLSRHSDLVEIRQKLKRFIQLNKNIILKLDLRKKPVIAFISLLLDVCEELGLIEPFRFLFNYIHHESFNLGSRLRAASLYIINIENIDDYITRYEEIYYLLQCAFENEEDSNDRILMTMVNYYALVIYNFGEFNNEKVQELRKKLITSVNLSTFSFLHSRLIKNVLNIDIIDFSSAYESIHKILDTFLGRDTIKPVYKDDFLLESGTEYCDLLGNTPKSFKSIRQISVSKYQLVKSDLVYNSLGRGVAVLTEENQLYAYMHSYGKMHFQKLIEAFEHIPISIFNNNMNIIDWGCGQAMASITYFDHLNSLNINHNIQSVVLIEPSELALKRASLHVKKFEPSTNIITINKDLDSIINTDLLNFKSHTNFHLFSNILDIDDFSLQSLLNLIENNFSGENYFICVSPYINDVRTARLDAFVYFFKKISTFEFIHSIDNQPGEWIDKWTRVVRIFKASW